jgi:F0F1-type ATP synthase membrane subunit b/b'
MKKSILTLVIATFVVGAMLTSCSTPAQKVADAQEDVTEAKEDLAEAKDEYLEDVENYRKETSYRIDANNQSIAEFRARIANEKKVAKADYEEKVLKLEQKNTDIKKRLDDYKVEGKDNWQTFKLEFNRDMDELGKALKDLTVKNNK